MAGIAPAPPPVPALPDTERSTTYSISSSTCACAAGFQLYGDCTDYANWIEVWINGALITQSGNWTITSPTGWLATIPRRISDAVLTFVAAQTGTVQIVGARRPRRTSQFSESRGVAERDLNQVLSDLTAQSRETWDKTNDITGRVRRVPPGETLAMLPPPGRARQPRGVLQSPGQSNELRHGPGLVLCRRFWHYLHRHQPDHDLDPDLCRRHWCSVYWH
jgi:hypothetical protein